MGTEALVSLGLLAVIGAAALAMYRKWLPAMLAVPLAAVGVALVALTPEFVSGNLSPVPQALELLFVKGPASLGTLLVAVVLGATLAKALELTGTTRTMVRFATEYAGSSQLSGTLVIALATTLLFTTVGGLGAVIMVASFTLPLLRAMRLGPTATGAVFLVSLSLGGTLNPVNWQFYLSLLEIEQTTVMAYASTVFFVMLAVQVALIVREQWRMSDRTELIVLSSAVAALGGTAGLLWWAGLVAPAVRGLGWTLLAVVALLGLFALGRLLTPQRSELPLLGYLALVFPLLWLFGPALIKWGGGPELAQPPIVLALAGGVAVAAASRGYGGRTDLVSRALVEGTRKAVPALVVIVGIGMLVTVTRELPQVTEAVRPTLTAVMPGSDIGLLGLGVLLAPLALYRGPMNLWGMGGGVLGVLAGAGIGSAPALMALFFSSGLLQGVCDPTNTHNVYLADRLNVEVFDLTRYTVPWIYPAVIAGLFIGALFAAN